MNYTVFDIVVVPFPFTDKNADKRRPALIISNERFHAKHQQYLLSMITTAKHSHWASDIAIEDYHHANLTSPSLIRCKLFTLDHDMIIRKLGRLSNHDIINIRANFLQYLF